MLISNSLLFLLSFFFFLELPVSINIRYVSVGIHESTVLHIIGNLFDNRGGRICSHPILTANEILACSKTPYCSDKDTRRHFNTVFGVGSKFVIRNTMENPAMNLRGNLQDALGFAGLRYITFAQSSVPGQQISISSSENFSDPKCIFKMSSDAIKNAENRLRESALHDDVQMALRYALYSAMTKEFCDMVLNCDNTKNSRVNDFSEKKSIRDILKLAPIELSCAPNGSQVRARPIKCPEVQLTMTGVLRLVVYFHFVYCPPVSNILLLQD